MTRSPLRTTHAARCLVAAITICTAWAALVSATAEAQPSADAAELLGVPDLRARLAALDASDPMAYFNLAEEIAWEERSEQARRVAQQLFVLAFELDRASAEPTGLGASVCLALADLADSPDERRWLLTMAGTLGREAGAAVESLVEQHVLDELVSAVWALRTHDLGVQRRSLLRLAAWRAGEDHVIDGRTGMVRGIAAAEQLLRTLGLSDGEAREVGRMLEDGLQTPSCRGCRNERVIRKGLDAEQRFELCDICNGNPGLSLTTAQDALLLRVEAVATATVAPTWSASFIVRDGAPLRDADPDELAAAFSVDPNASSWRATGPGPYDGSWTTPATPARDASSPR